MFVCLYLSFLYFLLLLLFFFNQLLEIYSQQYRNRVSLFNSSSGLTPPPPHFTFVASPSFLPHITSFGFLCSSSLFGMASLTHNLSSFQTVCIGLVRVCLPLVFTGWYCRLHPWILSQLASLCMQYYSSHSFL